mmetsp:Transcript_59266/g.135933  ORF Transcript_59266/g.135933 Transcript_59266/m.135933 type:complete len:388 (-) Transcript_59266:89-1252(-)
MRVCEPPPPRPHRVHSRTHLALDAHSALHRGDHRIAKLNGADRGLARRCHIARRAAADDCSVDRGFDGGGRRVLAKRIPQHHRGAQYLRRRVGDALAGDVGRRASRRLVQVDTRADGRGGHQAERTRQHGGGVRQDVAEHVLGANDVEGRRRLDELHRRIVDVHEVERHLRMLLVHLDRHLAPQPRRVQHVGLVDDRQLAGPPLGRLEREAQRPLDLLRRVRARVARALPVRRGRVLAEVDAAEQLAHNHHVDAALDEVGAERRRVRERRVYLCRPHVHGQVERFAHAEQRVALGVVPLWQVLLLDRAADRAEEDGVGALAQRLRLVGEVLAVRIVPSAADQPLLVSELDVREERHRSVENLARLNHHLGTDAVARQHGDPVRLAGG